MENEKIIEGEIEVEYVEDTYMDKPLNEDDVIVSNSLSCMENVNEDVSDAKSHVEQFSVQVFKKRWFMILLRLSTSTSLFFEYLPKLPSLACNFQSSLHLTRFSRRTA